jgi:superfamily II DNA or RNA helicase
VQNDILEDFAKHHKMMNILLNKPGVDFTAAKSSLGFDVKKVMETLYVNEVRKRFMQLNDSQREAVRVACMNRLTLIQGPPGTGKTKTLGMIAALMAN